MKTFLVSLLLMLAFVATAQNGLPDTANRPAITAATIVFVRDGQVLSTQVAGVGKSLSDCTRQSHEALEEREDKLPGVDVYVACVDIENGKAVVLHSAPPAVAAPAHKAKDLRATEL